MPPTYGPLDEQVDIVAVALFALALLFHMAYGVRGLVDPTDARRNVYNNIKMLFISLSILAHIGSLLMHLYTYKKSKTEVTNILSLENYIFY